MRELNHGSKQLLPSLSPILPNISFTGAKIVIYYIIWHYWHDFVQIASATNPKTSLMQAYPHRNYFRRHANTK